MRASSYILLTLIGVASSTAPLTISERTVRVHPSVEFTLTARGGQTNCFDWTSERPDIAEVVSESCGDGESRALVRTHAPAVAQAESSRLITFVTARPTGGEFDSVFCEINVGQIERLQVLTTVKKMLAHELQWLRLVAQDAEGNAFSPASLEALDITWRFEPDQYLTPMRPSETRQQLDDAITAAEAAGRWERYHRLAVRAGSEPRDPIKVTAVLRDRDASGGGVVIGHTTLSIEPSYESLHPSERAVVAPTMSLQYALRTCSRGGTRCAAPPRARCRPRGASRRPPSPPSPRTASPSPSRRARPRCTSPSRCCYRRPRCSWCRRTRSRCASSTRRRWRR